MAIAGDGNLVTIIMEPLGTSLQIEPGDYTIRSRPIVRRPMTARPRAEACRTGF